ncbi:uncharacterized protein LOC135128268 [Zophobas morio]|uniref:uncharacterized protein LOC135128268 n=1 Tax=Zophobas morio TaxID=2755281 RepID=UPI0030836927
MRIIETFLLLLVVSYAKPEDECNAHNNSCNDCIRKLGCSWFVKHTTELDHSNCFTNTNVSSYQASAYNPGSSINVIENLPLDDKILVAPQKLSAHLRLHSPVLFKVRFASKDESLVTPHDQNIIVQLLRTKPDFVIVHLEALRCPQDAKNFRQTLTLPTTQTQQKVTVDLHFNCECPF